MSICENPFLLPIITFLFQVGVWVANAILLADAFDDTEDQETSLNPDGWAFSIWGIIYAWNALWNVFLIFFPCSLKNKTLLFPQQFYFWFISSCIFNILWCFAAKGSDLWLEGVFLPIITLSLIFSSVSAHKYVYDAKNYESISYTDEVEESPIALLTSCHKSTLTVLILNGINIYAGWSTLAQNVNWAIILYKRTGLSNNQAVYVMIPILSIQILLYLYFDLFKFRKYLSGTITFYIPLITGLTGILTKWGDNFNRYPGPVFAAIALCIVIIAFIAKLTITCCDVGTKRGNQQLSAALVQYDEL